MVNAPHRSIVYLQFYQQTQSSQVVPTPSSQLQIRISNKKVKVLLAMNQMQIIIGIYMIVYNIGINITAIDGNSAVAQPGYWCGLLVSSFVLELLLPEKLVLYIHVS